MAMATELTARPLLLFGAVLFWAAAGTKPMRSAAWGVPLLVPQLLPSLPPFLPPLVPPRPQLKTEAKRKGFNTLQALHVE